MRNFFNFSFKKKNLGMTFVIASCFSSLFYFSNTKERKCYTASNIKSTSQKLKPNIKKIYGKKEIRILSIDGGGIRGVLPAVILNEIQNRTKKHPTELFDMIAGTSIGGILALGLVASAENDNKIPLLQTDELVDFFVKEGKTIFSEKKWKKISSLQGAIDEKYDSSGIDGFLQSHFGNRKMKDSIIPVFVTSFEIEKYTPLNFKSWDLDQDFLMSFAARSTSAAPTYFELAKGIHLSSGENYYCIDGGLNNNNPSLLALIEAKKLFPDAEKIFILSLGTGKMKKTLNPEKAKDWGAIGWLQPLLDIRWMVLAKPSIIVI